MLTIVHEPEASKAAAHLAERLTKELQAGKRVLWLVPGGSNIPLSVAVMGSLPAGLISQLTCLLTDERYGVPGHDDSNWEQLSDAGFMQYGVAFAPTLLPDLTIEDTCQQYGETVEKAMAEADIVIAQFGIGGDGHIAGILPRSPAITDTETVVGYDSGTFQRITLTPPVLQRCAAAYAFVYGDTKREALQKLHDENLSLDEQPSQLLKSLPEAFIYTDQKIGGTK